MVTGMNWNKFNKIEFSITTYCQAACPVCVRTNSVTLKKRDDLILEHLSLESYIKLIDRIKESKLKKIKLCGDYGDPLMHPQIEDFISISVENNFYLEIHTNGGIRNKEWFAKIAKKYGNRVQIAFGIDGVDSETSSKYRIGVDFDRAFENMIEYVSNGGRTVWDFLLFNFNKHQMEDACEIAKKHKIELYFKINTREYKDFKITDKDEINLLEKKILVYRKLTKQGFTYD